MANVNPSWELPPVESYADEHVEQDDGLDTAKPTVRIEPADAPISIADFYAYMPMHQYIFAPSGEMWPGSSVNARCGNVCDANGDPITKQISQKNKAGEIQVKEVAMRAAEWLDANQRVDQMTWAPGQPKVLEDQLISGGGSIKRDGARVFNLYIPPAVRPGNPDHATAWIDHINTIFPNDATHIMRWLAHRVQRPGHKINHALVLGGNQGIGKDTLLEPVKYAVGPWNFNEVSPAHLLGRFNSFVKSVVLRVSEARDLGDVDRYAFYDHMKVYTAAPPDVLRCDEKHLREHAVMNVCGVIITTNHKGDGIFLPADDRRHYVAWSDMQREDFDSDYWRRLYRWFEQGGHGHVAAYLAELDLNDFDPKAPPPKTAAFWEIVDANRAPEDAELADVLDVLGNPPALTIAMLINKADEGNFREWLQDRRSSRQIPHRMETAGYTKVLNAAAQDGLWKFRGKRQAIYALKTATDRDRFAAAKALCDGVGQ